MKRKILIVLGIIYLAFIVEFVIYMNSDTDSRLSEDNQKIANSPNVTLINSTTLKQSNHSSVSSQTAYQETLQTSQIRSSRENSQNESIIPISNSAPSTNSSPGEFNEEAPPADIKEIKRKIYNMRIEYIEDLEALEQIVQTGDANQSDFWEGDWSSADDWKRRDDSFQLEINNNGSFTFSTEDGLHQPSQAFTFDEEKREFYWEEDYYGKIISHRAKFVTPDTLLIIKTSGVKVNLDIYERVTR